MASKFSTLLTTLSAAERAALVRPIQDLLSCDFGVEVGEFEVDELLTPIADLMGPHFFNLGVQETRDFFLGRFQELEDDSAMLVKE